MSWRPSHLRRLLTHLSVQVGSSVSAPVEVLEPSVSLPTATDIPLHHLHIKQMDSAAVSPPKDLLGNRILLMEGHGSKMPLESQRSMTAEALDRSPRREARSESARAGGGAALRGTSPENDKRHVTVAATGPSGLGEQAVNASEPSSPASLSHIKSQEVSLRPESWT